MAHSQEPEGDPPTQQRANLARIHNRETVRDPSLSSACKPRAGRGARGPPQRGRVLPQSTAKRGDMRGISPNISAYNTRTRGGEGDTPTG